MDQRAVNAIAMVAGLAVLALFPLPFWFGLGVLGWKAPWQQGLVALVAAAIALLAVFVMVRVQRMLGGRLPPELRGPTQAETAALHAADLARIQADPALHHWLPFARRMTRFPADALARFQARYLELLAKPGGAPYAERLLCGDWVGDSEIDYLQHPDLLVTCEHLQPVERDLRRYGIRSYPSGPMNLWTQAWLSLWKLRTYYALPEFISEVHEGDHPHGPTSAFIRCGACGSAIESAGNQELPTVANATRS